MNNTVNKVKEFMLVTQHENVATQVTTPERKRVKLRMELIVEELYEYAMAGNSEAMIDFMQVLREYRMKMYKAIENGARGQEDPIKVLDALLDLQYVLDGMFVEHGMVDIKDSAFDEVHQSNMTKFCGNEQLAKDEVEHQRIVEGIECNYAEHEGKYILKNVKTDKVVKPRSYRSADLKHFIHGSL